MVWGMGALSRLEFTAINRKYIYIYSWIGIWILIPPMKNGIICPRRLQDSSTYSQIQDGRRRPNIDIDIFKSRNNSVANCPISLKSGMKIGALWVRVAGLTNCHRFGFFYFYRAAWNADAVLRWDFCPSVCLSVRLSNACIVTERKKDMFRFLYHTKEHLS